MLKDGIRANFRKGEDGFVRPNYKGYSLANVSGTISALFGVGSDRMPLSKELYSGLVKGKRPKKIVLFFIDGFGYLQWKRYWKRFEFFRRFTKYGLVNPITSTFPSTTAAAVTAVGTGLSPIQHNLIEWLMYLKKTDCLIETLPFRRPRDSPYHDTLVEEGVTARDLYKGQSTTTTLKKKRVKSLVFLEKGLVKSVYSTQLYAGAHMVPYRFLGDLFVSVRRNLKKAKGPTYLHAYIPDVDGVEHTFGPYGEEHESQLSIVAHMLQTEFIDKIDRNSAKDTLVIIIADHGQVRVNPDRVTYLNKYKKLLAMFAKGRNGKPIEPAGSPRDLFLHIKPGKIDAAYKLLAKELRGKAQVVLTKDAIKQGLFGPGKPDREFLNRAGDILILPYYANLVWYDFSDGTKKFTYKGHHGGLAEEEMLVPFAIAWLSDLIKK